MTAGTTALDQAHGVGGRLAVAKSQLYQETVGVVEGRANRFTARYMLASDIAYVLTAVELGVTPPEDGRTLLRCLLNLLADADRLSAIPATTDIVVQREAWVIERVGPLVGARLHVGRNRGEKSLRNYLPRLFFRQALHDHRRATLDLINALHAKAAPVLDAWAPVYHHLQHASVTTLGEYLLAFAAGLLPHLERLEQAEARLGLAPPAQSGRDEVVRTAAIVGRRLGFSNVALLRQQMHVTEDHLVEPYFAMTLVNVVLSRLLSDLRIWMTEEFHFFDVSDFPRVWQQRVATEKERVRISERHRRRRSLSRAARGPARLKHRTVRRTRLDIQRRQPVSAGARYYWLDALYSRGDRARQLQSTRVASQSGARSPGRERGA